MVLNIRNFLSVRESLVAADADPLSVPVWQNTYGEARKPLLDPLASFAPNSSVHHASASFFSPQPHGQHSSMQPAQPRHIHHDSTLEPAVTPSTLRSPSDNGLLASNRAFSPTGAIIHSALANTNGYAISCYSNCICWPCTLQNILSDCIVPAGVSIVVHTQHVSWGESSCTVSFRNCLMHIACLQLSK